MTPSPKRLDRPLEIDEVDRHRELDCTHARRCLDHAAAHGWKSYSCRGCMAYEPMGEERQRAELAGLHRLGLLLEFAAEHDLDPADAWSKLQGRYRRPRKKAA